MTHAEKHHGKDNHHHMEIMHICHSHVACAKTPFHFFHVASMPVSHDANSCCVPLDVHQQTTVLVTGNHYTAALTGSYVHKLPQNT